MDQYQIHIPQMTQINTLLKDTNTLLNSTLTQLKSQNLSLQTVPHISGLYYCEDIIDIKTENDLINKINNESWLSDLTRRVQHYGYKYDYKKRRIDRNDYLGELPIWTTDVEKKLFNLINESNIQLPYNKFDQLIINEYKSNQGISAHVDCVPCFEDGIASLTIGCSGIMTFSNGTETHDVLLKRRSIVLLTNESRYKWTHSILPSKNKIFTNSNPRISLTFRKVKQL